MAGSDDEVMSILARVDPACLLGALEDAPAMVTLTSGPQHCLVWRNRLARRLYGPAERGRPLVHLYPETAESAELWDRAFAGEAVTDSRRPARTVDGHGRRRLLRVSMAPLLDASGNPIGVVQVACDATAEHEAQRQAAHGRILATATEAAVSADHPSGALQALADTLVPAMADMAAVYAYPNPDIGSAMQERVSPVALALSAALRRLGPLPAPARWEIPVEWRDTLTAGRILSVRVEPSTIGDLAPTAEARQWLAAAGASSMALAPLVVAGRLAGGLLLMTTAGRPDLDDSELAFLRELTTVAGACIAEVGGRQRDRRGAERLQRALLPAAPSRPAGCTLATRYVPAGTGWAVGGDWWDVLDMGAGMVGLGLGDISGHGIGAAALMGQARVAMRTAGHTLGHPGLVLEEVDARLAEAVEQQGDDSEIDLHRFATGIYAVVEMGRHTMSVASAGHLPLILKRRGGSTRPVWAPPGPPLGLGIGGYGEISVGLAPGDMVVLYTDGLVEDRSRDLLDGIDRLVEVVAGLPADCDVESAADALVAGMGVGGGGVDDIALVVFSPSGTYDPLG